MTAMGLNYYAINRILKGRMIAVSARPRFGKFAQLKTAADVLRHARRPPSRVVVTREIDALIAEAFEKIRDGRAPERIMWDKKLAKQLYRRAREIGVDAPDAVIGRRLINIRKNPKQYERHGISLSPTTIIDPKPSVVPRYAHVIEFALVRLRYVHGASIDDILLDQSLAEQYEAFVREMAPVLTPQQIRLGALYIRKTRFLAARERTLFEEMNADALEAELIDVGTVAKPRLEVVPDQAGIWEILENDRTLYVSRNDDLRAAVSEFATGPTLKVMKSPFWEPDPTRIHFRILVGQRFADQGFDRWQLKLIHELKPVFNWPVSEDGHERRAG